MLKKYIKNQKGLTLIELLAVIVILGIIAAIAVPSIGNLINNTKEKAKVAEAVQIIDAAKLAHATKNSQTTWTYDADPIVDGTIYLKDYLDSVNDTSFTVNYDGKTYTITGHEATAVISGTDPVSETALENYLK
ncbi:type II secretion system protein [Bacillus sp. JJ1566]|uniref:type IV pilin protein n=1 Tax=Bacillus sp. JJ1566 TaxID=3122961 RepID=UPI002FFDBB86